MKIILYRVLHERGISQRQLAKLCGVREATISNLVNGKTTRIDYALIDKICAALNIGVEDIFEPDSGNTIVKTESSSDSVK
jgi:putative transcriptional regulator